jgi:hypothetical protein
MNTKKLTKIGWFTVDSGQAIVGDPCYLDEWDTNKNEQWPNDLSKKAGEYSYHGASGMTCSPNGYGELGGAKAVVFSTGYGDGLYPVYAQLDNDGRVAKIVIEFIKEVN